MTQYRIKVENGAVYVIPEYVQEDQLTSPMRLLAASVVAIDNNGKTIKNRFGKAGE